MIIHDSTNRLYFFSFQYDKGDKVHLNLVYNTYIHTYIHTYIRGWVRKFCHRYYNFVNKHDRLLYYTLTERATFLLYNDVKIIPVKNKYIEIDILKDTWGKTNGTFSRICEYYCVRFMRHIVITTDQIFSIFTVINNSIFRKAM